MSDQFYGDPSGFENSMDIGFVSSNYCGQMMPQSTLGVSQFAMNPPATVTVQFGTPTIRPLPNIDPSVDAKLLRKAMKGIGCNSKVVLEIICTRSNSQRQQIKASFGQMFGRDLIKDLLSELSGNFKELIIALMTTPAVYDAKELYRAMEGLGTKENILIEIMCSRTNAQIRAIKSAYIQIFRRNLEDDIIGDTSGYFKNVLLALCAAVRDESGQQNVAQAREIAKTLFRAGEGRWGTNETVFIKILSTHNFCQLALIFNEYRNVTGHSMDVAIRREFSGDIKDALLAIFFVCSNRFAFFAEEFENSMKGLGTKDRDLIRLTVTRSEFDLADIKREYQRLFGRKLEDRIIDDTSGKYRNALLTLVRGNY
uniref:Annexin n=1 Tax=Parastrongyloides trichosuri TaxID=131310 RepID=A0A0N4Z9X1_PARTI